MQDIIKKNIVEDFGLGSLDPKEQEETILRIGNVIYQAIMIRVLSILSEEDQNELDKLVDEINEGKKTQAQMTGFLQYKISNFDDIILEEIQKFRDESVKVMEGVE